MCEFDKATTNYTALSYHFDEDAQFDISEIETYDIASVDHCVAAKMPSLFEEKTIAPPKYCNTAYGKPGVRQDTADHNYS